MFHHQYRECRSCLFCYSTLSYRTTPTEIGYSPAELLMSRKLCTTVPLLPELRKPVSVDPSEVAEKDAKLKTRQKHNFDEQHGTRELSSLLPGDTVWIPNRQFSASKVHIIFFFIKLMVCTVLSASPLDCGK